MLFAKECAGFISSCYGECGQWRFGCFFGFFQCHVHMGALLVYTLLCTRLGSRWRASCLTRPLGRGRWGHYLCDHWGECLAGHKIACQIHENICGFYDFKLYMGEIAGKSMVRPLFLLSWFFCLVGVLRVRFWGLILWHLWIGRARHPGPASPSQHVGLEVFNVGGCADSWGFSLGRSG